jgi:hypothetical protein
MYLKHTIGRNYKIKILTLFKIPLSISNRMDINTLYTHELPLFNRILITLIAVVYVGFMVFNATFNNFSSVILWRSVLLMEEIGVPGENLRSVASH